MLPPTERENQHVPQEAPQRTPPGIPSRGSVIADKYEVVRVLGAGGMGVVVAARHVQLGQTVAIKFMRAEGARDENAVGRFLREARAAVALSSEHVARVLDVGTLDDGAPYMVMEYLAGIDLAQMLRQRGPLPVEAAVGLLLQACEAVAEAHARGIVHRDLKPSNLFLSSRVDGSPLVKVLDFGISKAAAVSATPDAASLTASGVVMGSPAYMSPEHVRSSKDVDARSDIWSLGVILYELLTGVCPFHGETLGDTFAKITSETPTPIRTLRPDIPEGLAAIIDRCLTRSLAARVQTVGDLASGLLPFASAEAAFVAGRILRLAGKSSSTSTLTAPTTAAHDSRTQTPSPTDAAWLRSGVTATPPMRSRMPLAILGAAAAIALASIATRYVWRPAAPPVAIPSSPTTGTPVLAVSAPGLDNAEPPPVPPPSSRPPEAAPVMAPAPGGLRRDSSNSSARALDVGRGATPRPAAHRAAANGTATAGSPSGDPEAALPAPGPIRPPAGADTSAAGDEGDPFSRLKHK